MTHHVFDALPSHPDPRDFRMMAVDLAPLPASVALPPVPIKDQGNEGACVGHGCAGARETLTLVQHGAGIQIDTPDAPPAISVQVPVPLSRAFIYYKARAYEHSTRTDSGAEVRDGCKVMQKIGVCTEEQFPYKVGDFAKAPPKVDVTAAAAYKIGAYTRLANTEQCRAALAAGHPVVIGISVYPSFENVGRDGLIPLPATNREQLLGGHCIFLYGYHPDPKRPGKFLMDAQNSWGAWADGGRCHIPQDYLNDPNLCSDLWSVSLI